MASTRGLLGAPAAASAATDTLLYTVAATGVLDVVLSGVWVTNTVATPTTYSLAIVPAGQSVGPIPQWCYRHSGAALGANAVLERLLRGVVLVAGDKLYVNAAAAGVTFAAYGQINA